jgi:YHS domain-containing protein
MKAIKTIFAAFVLLLTTVSFGQTQPIDENGLAIGGYDLVSYHSSQPTKGLVKYQVKHNKATYYFVSSENLKAFKANPEKYLPAYGGFCAWGVAAKKAKFPIDPETYDIIDGKLYLFFNGEVEGKMLNTLLPWNAETSSLKKDGDKNWKKM